MNTTALWESLRAPRSPVERPKAPRVHIFAVGQDGPDAVDAIRPIGSVGASHLYGVVVAVPNRPSPLAGSLLYQGRRATYCGRHQAGAVEPALLHELLEECKSYANRLLERLSPLLEA